MVCRDSPIPLDRQPRQLDRSSAATSFSFGLQQWELSRLHFVTVDRSCTFGNALVPIGTSSMVRLAGPRLGATDSSPPSALHSFACPELAIIHKANTVSTTGDLLLLLTSHLQGLHYRCSGSTTELGTDQEAAIIRSVAVLCRLGPWHLPLCTMHSRPRVLPQEWLETTQTHIDIGSASIPSLSIRYMVSNPRIELGFPIDPKRVPACINGELELPLINGFCTPFAAKQRRFSPEERRMVRAEIQQLVDRGVIRQSMSPWAAECLCVKKKDGTFWSG